MSSPPSPSTPDRPDGMWRAHSRPRGESISDIGACFGVDIGGTLSKLVFFAPDDSPDLDSVLGLASNSNSNSDSDSSPMSNSNEGCAGGATGGAAGCVGGGAEIGFWKTQIARITELCVSAASEDRRSSDWRGVHLPDQRSTEGGEDGEGGGGPADAMASFHSEDHRGTFHFVSVETRRLQEVCRYIKDAGLNQGLREMYVAGGGGHKYRQLFADELEITLVPVDELKTMIVALTFLISQDPNEIYTLEEAVSASGGRGAGGGDGGGRSAGGGTEGGVPGEGSGGGGGGGGVGGCTGGDEDLVRRHTGPARLVRATTEDSGGGVGGGIGGGVGGGKDEGNRGGNLGDAGSKRTVTIEGKGETDENGARGGGAHIDALQIDIPSAPQQSAQGGRGSGSAGHFRSIRRPLGLRGALFPFVLCNIGSGVSILHVESVDKFTRISGSALGGATFWGLTRVMVAQPLASFSEALDLAEQGEAAAVNMCVRDIYGGAYKKHGLDENLTASFFGKVTGDVHAKNVKNAKAFSPPSPAMASRGGNGVGGEGKVNGQGGVQEGAQGGVGSNKHFSVPDPSTSDVEGEMAGRGGAGSGAGGGTSGTERPRDEDICRALLLMVSQNITQIAFLNARLVGVQRILFTGNFLRHNNIAMQVLTQSLQRWSDLSGVPIRALFVAHEGFLGALGAYLNNYL